MSERIQKLLANAGIASRRTIEQWIRDRRIMVNGKIAELGKRITAADKVMLDGKLLQLALPAITRVLLYHKPVGEICTRSEQKNRGTVFDNLPKLKHGRWIAIGRLDVSTSGLLLFTNNGELANQWMHPKTQLEREYMARVLGDISAESLQQLQKGVRLEDGMAHFEKITVGKSEAANRWYKVIVKEGRNRLVRRLFESQRLQVSRLMRIRFGDISLPRSLKSGQFIELHPEKIKSVSSVKK